MDGFKGSDPLGLTPFAFRWAMAASPSGPSRSTRRPRTRSLTSSAVVPAAHSSSTSRRPSSPRRRVLQTKTTSAEAAKNGIHVKFDKGDPAVYDLVLVSVGRSPHGKRIDAEKGAKK